MADWKNLLKVVLLADGTIDLKETQILKEEILADGIVDQEEIDFLIDLNNSSSENCSEFTSFFYEALISNVLEDGVIDKVETERIRKIIFADGVIDAEEKEFLKKLRDGAKELCPEFQVLLKECL